jgi:ureidoacrylate peracid hydrolase
MPPHSTIIREDVQRLVQQRRGSGPLQPVLAAKDTALIVIDMQTAFVDTSLPSGVPMAQSIVPNINRLAATVRERGGKVVWVFSTFDDTTKDNWSAFFGGVYPDELSRAVIDNLRTGSDGHRLFAALDLNTGDKQFSKNRFSAFFPGACDLPEWLRQQGIHTVAIAGTLTNVCCESSARDAMMQNFNVVMISDANAARTDADHNASLTALLQTFADVLDTDTFISTLQPQGSPAVKMPASETTARQTTARHT